MELNIHPFLQLPSDWRDVIERAVSRERRTTSTLPTIDTIVDPSCPDAHRDDTELSPERLSPSNTVRSCLPVKVVDSHIYRRILERQGP